MLSYIANDLLYEYLRNRDDGNFQVLYEELDFSISTDETISVIKILKYCKSAGPDLVY